MVDGLGPLLGLERTLKRGTVLEEEEDNPWFEEL